jgi:hypothetical protein
LRYKDLGYTIQCIARMYKLRHKSSMCVNM